MDSRRWQEIQTSFHTLVELEESERANRLATVETTDPELRRAVEALLAADAEASALLAPIEAAFLPAAGAAIDPLGLAGRTVAHFNVGEPLGSGGMGVVYRAQDTRLGRAVALKFLLPPYNLDAAAKARFLREAHSAATLDHPNLCNIHDVGTTDDGRLFLAMALYPGETLRERLSRDGAMPVPEALEIARQIAEGLDCAHAAGIVHRDLKPGNVMLLPDGSVKILDFGLAKMRDQSLSETSARLGTVSYMAPEQMRGQAVDGRADLWALGVVLYEMLTERKPFAGEQDIAVAHSILHDEPAPPSMHRRNLPGAVEDLVLKLLHKDPASRYATAAELLVDLARARTATASVQRSLRRRLRRARQKLSTGKGRMLAAAAAVLLTVAGAYAAIARDEVVSAAAAARTTIAVLPFRNLSGDSSHAYLAAGLEDDVVTQLYKVSALKVIGRNSVTRYTGPNAPPLRQMGAELGVGSVVDAGVQVVGGRLRVNVRLLDPQTGTQRWAERYDRALDDAFALQSDVAHHIVNAVGAALTGAESQRLVERSTNSNEAYLLYLQGLDYLRQGGWEWRKFQLAEQLLMRALALDTAFALAHAALAQMHTQIYWYRLDRTPARLARQRAEAEAALRLAPDLPGAHLAMAVVHQMGPGSDMRRGLEETRIAVRGAPNDAFMWERLAGVHRRLGNWDSSFAAFNKALEVSPRDQRLFQDHGAWMNTKLGRFEEAIRWLDSALTLSPDDQWAKIAKGWTYAAWQGQLDTLRDAMSGLPGDELRHGGIVAHLEFLRTTRQPDSLLRVLKTAKDRVFNHPFYFLPTPLYAGWAHEMRGDHRAARAAFDSALAVLDSATRELPEEWPVHWARGMALAGLDRRQEALREARWLRESLLYHRDAFFGPTVALVAAELLARSGEANAAIDELEPVLAEGAFGNIMQPFGTTVHSLRLNPTWDPIREHPRFKALLTKFAKQG